MKKEDKKVVDNFEIHARSPDRVPYIMMKEQLAVLKEIHKSIDGLKEVIKQENLKHVDDGK